VDRSSRPRRRLPGRESLSLHDAARRFAKGLRRLAARPERVVLAVRHELPIRFALNAASGSANLDRPEHKIANATPYLFEQAALDLAAEGIERLVGR
jgi:broad specificity phosphatase PhoE